MPDPSSVNSMFSRIARRYDLANRLLSGGMDVRWRKRLVAQVREIRPRDVLDLATGSGDVAFALSQGLPANVNIVGMDFCQPMLDQAEAKKAAHVGPEFATVRFEVGDALALPAEDESFDAVTISFGLRNLADRARGLREMRRVLRPGGCLFVLEFSQPHAAVRPLYFFYLRRILPRVAGVLTGDRAAYQYLNETIEEFPNRAALEEEIRAAGFSAVRSCGMTVCTVALHHATR